MNAKRSARWHLHAALAALLLGGSACNDSSAEDTSTIATPGADAGGADDPEPTSAETSSAGGTSDDGSMGDATTDGSVASPSASSSSGPTPSTDDGSHNGSASGVDDTEEEASESNGSSGAAREDDDAATDDADADDLSVNDSGDASTDETSADDTSSDDQSIGGGDVADDDCHYPDTVSLAERLEWQCSPEGQLGCVDGVQLECGADQKWLIVGECADGEACDTNSDNTGACAPVLAECECAEAYRGMCVGDLYVECKSWVEHGYEQACSSACVEEGQNAYCIQQGCGDGQLTASEACDDGNNENGDGCSAACKWEPNLGEPSASRGSFGDSVAFAGDQIVIGASTDSSLGINAGAVYVYGQSGETWALEERLTAKRPDGSAFTFVGGVSAIDDLIVAHGRDETLGEADYVGAAFVFARSESGWAQQATLYPIDPGGKAGEQSFGLSALTENTIVIGAEHDLEAASFGGAAHVFRKTETGWEPEAKLLPRLADGTLDGNESAYFGAAVGVSGDTVAVGAFRDGGQGAMTGAVYVFERDGGAWGPTQKLYADDATDGAYFGKGLALKGDTMVVGSYSDQGLEANATSAGSAYVFTRTAGGWSQSAHLRALPDGPDDSTRIAEFGYAVAISDNEDLIAVGSPNAGYANSIVGSLHVFRRTGGGWDAGEKLTIDAPRGRSTGRPGGLGISVAVKDGYALAGTEGSSGQGRAFLFHARDSQWLKRLELLAVEP